MPIPLDIPMVVEQRLRADVPNFDGQAREAVALAKELNADFLIIHEKAGRKVAAKEQVQTIGIIGVLEVAATSGLLDLAAAFVLLKASNFHVTHEFLERRLVVYEQLQFRKLKDDDAQE